MFRRHPLLSVVTFGYLAFVGWVTLSPAIPVEGTDGFTWKVLAFLDGLPGTWWINYADVGFAANVAMFFPVGMFFVLLLGRRRWWLAILFGVALSSAIELAQLLLSATRVGDLRDVLSNSSGATLGAITALILTAARARELRHAARARQSDRMPALQP